MLDHVFLDAIGALRKSFQEALLERQAFEERFQVDILLGDVTWETSYGLPGEGTPPRVRADLTLDWPTWSQTAFRSWYIGEPPDEQPEILLEVVLRVQRLRQAPDPAVVVAALPDTCPSIGDEPLEQSGPTVEHVFGSDLKELSASVEVTYEGSCHLDERAMEDSSVLEERFGAVGGWVASTLVRLGDLKLDFLPPEEVPEH